MIHFLVGKPRNGKSLLAMMRIWEALTTTDRYIITNMVIFLDVLQELLIQRGFPSVNVRRRLRMLDDKETKNFWLHREYDLVLPVPRDYDEKSGSDVDYSPVFTDERFYVPDPALKIDDTPVRDAETEEPRRLKGTFYVIDEVHTHWRARGWLGTPRHVDFYNSQHGKLNDTVIFITQNTKLVDANFLRLAQDFTYCRNHRLEKHGRFRGDNKFTAHTYPGPVSSDSEVTLNRDDYKLDLPLARCYDTSAGVGMPGGGAADAGFRVKGISLKWVWVGLAAVLVAFFSIFNWGVPYVTGSYFASDTKPEQEEGSVNDPAPTGASHAVVVPERSASLSYSFPPDDVTPERPLHVTGYAIRGRAFIVNLSNGESLSADDKIVQAINPQRVLLRDGVVLRVRARVLVPDGFGDSAAPTVPVAPASPSAVQQLPSAAAPAVPESASGTAHEVPGKSTYRL